MVASYKAVFFVWQIGKGYSDGLSQSGWLYLMSALPVHRLDILGGSLTSSLVALCRSIPLGATSMTHRSVLSRRRLLHGYRPRHSYAYCVVAHHAGTPLNGLDRERNLLGPADPVASSLRTSRLGNS